MLNNDYTTHSSPDCCTWGKPYSLVGILAMSASGRLQTVRCRIVMDSYTTVESTGSDGSSCLKLIIEPAIFYRMLDF